ncbi:MAG: CDP-diacylglycerol--glycerol-3-phosphate 3-phosphatidyltransferase [bacterium]|nr:CDP-diacylglycerol--glycerol-3-phosphate 3-phosphatidyltransferase [bacterium]
MAGPLKLKSPPYLNIANLVSLLRLVLLPVFFYFLFYYIKWRGSGDGDGVLAHVFYLLALVTVPVILFTDYLDGWLARRFKLVNPLGAFLDPLADKFFAFFAIALLAWAEELPVWLAMVVFFKELFILVGWVLLFILGYDTEISPCGTGKAAAVCQGAVVLAALLTLPGQEVFSIPGVPLHALAQLINQMWFHIVTAALTTLAGAFYVLEGLQRSQRILPVEDEKVTVLQVGESGQAKDH